MTDFRIKEHPILPIPQQKKSPFIGGVNPWKPLRVKPSLLLFLHMAFAFLVTTHMMELHKEYSAPMDNVPSAWSSQMGSQLNPAWNWSNPISR